MYKHFIRPLLFLLPPEKVHALIMNTLRFGFKVPGLHRLASKVFGIDDNRLRTTFLGLNFKNPVGLAAGFDKNAEYLHELAAFGFGFIEIGTVTPRPQPGNPKPRSFRLKKDKALINRMGFNNNGVDAAVEHLKARPKNLIVGGNIGKNTDTPNENALADYVYCFERLYDYVDYFVVNVSCPNITNLAELQEQDALEQILAALNTKRSTKDVYKPILLKISPDLNPQQVDSSLAIVQKHHIEGVVVANTTITRNNLRTAPSLIAEIGRGGMSGMPLREGTANRIDYIRKHYMEMIGIIGVGGIFTDVNAKIVLNAGANVLQVYTGFIYEGPFIVRNILRGLLAD